jgi:hypothetical protein
MSMAKIDDLRDAVTSLVERVSALDRALNALAAAHAETARMLSDVRRDYEKEIALLKRDIEDLKKWKDDEKKAADERSRRLWAFGPNLVAAIISLFGVLLSIAGSFAIAYFIKQ